MRRLLSTLAVILALGLSAGGVRAESLELLDGTTVAGEIVLPAMPDGLNIHLYTGKYQKVPWDNFSPATLAQLAKNPGLAAYVKPLLEPAGSAQSKTQEIKVREPERLSLPQKGSLAGALFHSPVGVVALLLVYIAGIYAGYEISIVRSYPPLLVCGVSAVAPFAGQILFLCLPSRMVSPEDEASAPVRESAHAESQWAPSAASAAPAKKSLPASAPEPTAEPQAIPETQVFAKGQFMFNRRFFETKFPGFFSLVRKDADKRMMIIIRSARGEIEGHRISRITSNELFVDGSTTPIPFVEIMEVTLKHEDA